MSYYYTQKVLIKEVSHAQFCTRKLIKSEVYA